MSRPEQPSQPAPSAQSGQSEVPDPLRACVLVTGATRGLGLAVTAMLLGEGYRVVGTGRTRSDTFERLQQTHPSNLSFARLDLADSSTVHDFVRQTVAEHGTLYALVNNAAVAHDGVLATQHPSQIEEMLTVNLLSTILLTKAALRSMLVARQGRIVNVASIVAQTGFSGLSVYGATKAGLVGFSKSLAREAGRAGITVNVVAPGFLETDMSAGLGEQERAKIVRRSSLGRLTDVGNVAAAISYLLSAGAADVTGTVLTVDAGSTA